MSQIHKINNELIPQLFALSEPLKKKEELDEWERNAKESWEYWTPAQQALKQTEWDNSKEIRRKFTEEEVEEKKRAKAKGKAFAQASRELAHKRKTLAKQTGQVGPNVKLDRSCVASGTFARYD